MKLPQSYKGEPLPLHYRVDFICFYKVIAEIKALKTIGELVIGVIRG